MIKLLFVFVALIIIFLILRSKNLNKNSNFNNFYKKIIISIIVIGILIFIATSGKFLIPQLLQIFKIGLPILTKLIGI